MEETQYFIHAFIKKCLCICSNQKAYKHIYMILYGIFTNTEKAAILQTCKNVPCMIKAKP